MKSELQKQLIEKYSVFFQTDKKIYTGEKTMAEEIQELADQKEMVEPIQFGIACDDGWYWLLDNLMGAIYNYCYWNHKPFINITQIKEKFGSLSFYYNNGDAYIQGMVMLVSHLSLKTCETCGSTKNVGHTSGGWVFTVCHDCYENNEKMKKYTWKSN